MPKDPISAKFTVKPRVFIPTLYFIEGLPYTIVNLMSIAFFKNLNATNEFIGLVTSLLSFPWVIKLFWAPLVDLYGTRRLWILVAHAVLAVLCFLLSIAIVSSYHFPFTLAIPGFLSPNQVPIEIPSALILPVLIFVAVGFTSATQDVAIDGYYMDVLDKSGQSLYVGVRNAAYKIAWLTGQGALVFVAGAVAERAGLGYNAGWASSFGICALLLAAAFVFHSLVLPRPGEAHAAADHSETAFYQMRTQFAQVFKTFFTQKGIAAIIAYILLFRMGDALMLKMAQPFLLDPVEKGGLGIPTSLLGIIYGTVGTIFLLIGGIAGSWLISTRGLRKWLLPTAVVQNSAILLYWILAVVKPGAATVAVVNAFEQFSYGLGSAAYTVYLLSTVKPEYKAAHYAIATGMMAFGLMIPGALSGYLTEFGYPAFFLISFAASIPGIITIFLLPFREETS